MEGEIVPAMRSCPAFGTSKHYGHERMKTDPRK